jgi:hypothetical protein
MDQERFDMGEQVPSKVRCIHEMLEGTCAICLRQKLGDEEEELIFKGILDKEVKK